MYLFASTTKEHIWNLDVRPAEDLAKKLVVTILLPGKVFSVLTRDSAQGKSTTLIFITYYIGASRIFRIRIQATYEKHNLDESQGLGRSPECTARIAACPDRQRSMVA